MKHIQWILGVTIWAALGASAEVIQDQAYGEHAAQKMDLYIPSGVTNAPVMIYVHGGGWRIGDKGRVSDKARFFNDMGWIFISINYRLLPDGRHPANVEDVAAAIAWTHDKIRSYGGNPESIFIMGHSAGAHLVSLVAVDGRHLEKHGKTLAVIKGVIALDTQAYDIPELVKQNGTALYREVFGDDPDALRDASPLYHVAAEKNIPPFLICCSRGMSKRTNPQRVLQADIFASALGVFGIPAEVVDASDRNHGEINQWFGKESDTVVTPRAFRFLEKLCAEGVKPSSR